MPFGLKNAPATFSRLMRKVVRGIGNVYVYMDDILIATETWEDHCETMQRIFERV